MCMSSIYYSFYSVFLSFSRSPFFLDCYVKPLLHHAMTKKKHIMIEASSHSVRLREMNDFSFVRNCMELSAAVRRRRRLSAINPKLKFMHFKVRTVCSSVVAVCASIFIHPNEIHITSSNISIEYKIHFICPTRRTPSLCFAEIDRLLHMHVE